MEGTPWWGVRGGGAGHGEPMSMDMGIHVYDECACAWGSYGHMGIWFHGLMLLGWHVILIHMHMWKGS